MKYGGGGGTRTPDRVIMIHLLYRLSYTATKLSADNTGCILKKSTDRLIHMNTKTKMDFRNNACKWGKKISSDF